MSLESIASGDTATTGPWQPGLLLGAGVLLLALDLAWVARRGFKP